MAPEIMQIGGHDSRVDVFSFGYTLAVLIGSEYPFRSHHSGPDFRHRICGYTNTADQHPYYCCDVGQPCNNGAYWTARFQWAGAGAYSLVQRLCDPNPASRMTLVAALADPWWGPHALTERELAEIMLKVQLCNARRAKEETAVGQVPL